MYILYATTENGDGYVSKIGEYDSLEDIAIHLAMFAKDVVITIEKTLPVNED